MSYKICRRCPKERSSYLRELVTEFQDTNSADAKEEVLANLANFGYDPQNYVYFRQLNIVQLFLDHLDDVNEKLVEFSIGGLCNVALDKNFKSVIIQNGVTQKVISCLSSTNEEIVVSAITTLMFLVTPQSKQEITSLAVIDCMLRFKMSSNRRLSNLAAVFLSEYCTPQQVWSAQELCKAYGENSSEGASGLNS